MKSIVVCASKRYKDSAFKLCDELEKHGILVYRPNISEPINEDAFLISDHITKTIFKGLTFEHFDWIRKADVCYVFNKEDYVGISVSLEMGYAEALGKVIIAYSAETGDPCRNALIDFVEKEPTEIAKLLN